MSGHFLIHHIFGLWDTSHIWMGVRFCLYSVKAKVRKATRIPRSLKSSSFIQILKWCFPNSSVWSRSWLRITRLGGTEPPYVSTERHREFPERIQDSSYSEPKVSTQYLSPMKGLFQLLLLFIYLSAHPINIY